MSDVREEFTSHALNAAGQLAVDEIAKIFSDALTKLEDVRLSPRDPYDPEALRALGGRARALMLTKLQEAKMWAVRAVAETPAAQEK